MRIEDLFDNEPKEEPVGVEVFIDGQCAECFAPADRVFYSKENKRLTTNCTRGHSTSVEANFDWLLDG